MLENFQEVIMTALFITVINMVFIYFAKSKDPEIYILTKRGGLITIITMAIFLASIFLVKDVQVSKSLATLAISSWPLVAYAYQNAKTNMVMYILPTISLISLVNCDSLASTASIRDVLFYIIGSAVVIKLAGQITKYMSLIRISMADMVMLAVIIYIKFFSAEFVSMYVAVMAICFVVQKVLQRLNEMYGFDPLFTTHVAPTIISALPLTLLFLGV